MSLIMDGLKKTQQLRSKDSKGGPFFRHGRNHRSSNKRKWIIFGSALLSILFLLVIFWEFFLLKPTPPPRQTVSLAEKIHIPIDTQKESSPQTEEESLKPEPVKEIKPSFPEIAPVLSNIPKDSEPIVEKRIKESITANPIPEKITRLAQPEDKPLIEEKMSATPSLPPPPKEEVSIPSVQARVEIGKGNPHASEIINHFNMGISLHDRGDILGAIQAYQKVIEMDPAYVEAYNNLGIIYQEAGDFESALRNYQKAVEVFPGYERGLNNIGILHHLKGDDKKAEEVFKKVLTINPNHLEAHINLGTLYKKGGQFDRGVESYRKALAIHPSHGETHYNLGLLYEQLGKTDLAIRHYEQFIQSSSNSYPELAARVRRHIQQMMKARSGKKE